VQKALIFLNLAGDRLGYLKVGYLKVSKKIYRNWNWR